LRGSQFIRPLYYEALKNPEARIEAAKQIDRLAPEDRKDAIVAAFQYPECRPMAARAIASLASSADRADVLQLVSTDPGVRITLALQSAVPVDQGETVNGWLNQYVSDFGLIPTHH
jgi:hypothetical protein